MWGGVPSGTSGSLELHRERVGGKTRPQGARSLVSECNPHLPRSESSQVIPTGQKTTKTNHVRQQGVTEPARAQQGLQQGRLARHPAAGGQREILIDAGRVHVPTAKASGKFDDSTTNR